jgi:hypothetical protein
LYGSISLLFALMLQASGVEPQVAAAAPWEQVHRWVGVQRDRMAQDLETAHAALLTRALAAGEDALVERLRVEPPRPRPHGYGILPEIVDDPPRQPVVTRRNTYSLETLSTSHTRDFRDAALLAGRVTSEPDLPLVPWVGEFERLRERMQNLEDHLDYHAKWQVEVVAHRAWFYWNNRIIDKVGTLNALQAQNAPTEQIKAARAEVLSQLDRFRPTPGLRLETRDDGARVLIVEVCTDIDDEAFLETVRRAVEETYAGSAAARSRRFVLDLRWRRIPSDALYPEGPPAHGSEIDPDDHERRFPEGALVVTTGAASTHAWTGRCVRLGPSPLARRTLAHEFSHLLGFDDAYLRGHEGDPRGTFGAVLVEWVGLRDDLMGNPQGGEVTAEMVEKLLDAYGDTPAAE